MSLIELAALILALAAGIGVLNHWTLRLPHTIGLVVFALLVSLVLMATDALFPQFQIGITVQGILNDVNFGDTVLKGLLSVLLFAGALHVDLTQLAKRGPTIAALSTIGVLISTAINGFGFYALAWLLGFDNVLTLPICLVFGALISPTDPVAVLALLKNLVVPKELKAMIAGESLFNDGVAIVVFLVLASIAFAGHGDGHAAEVTASSIANVFVLEAGGGLLLGFVLGGIGLFIMRSMDEYVLEVLVTLALVIGGYALALKLHVSGPLAMVVAGLMVGSSAAQRAMSAQTKDYLEKFWELLDEILNSALFVLIGFEILILSFQAPAILLALLAVPLALGARAFALFVPLSLLATFRSYEPNTLKILLWAGLRGGISVALALTLPDTHVEGEAMSAKDLILVATFAVVLFTILVQGLTIERLLKRWL